MRALAGPAIGAATLALAVGLVVATIDSRYAATASVAVRGVVGTDDTLRTMLLEKPRFDLALDERAPLLPDGRRSLAAVRRRTADRLGDVSVETLRDDVRVGDSAVTPVFPRFVKPSQRLEFVAEAGDARRAADLATAFMTEYVAYRDAWYESNFRRVAAGLRARLRALPERPRLLLGAPSQLPEAVDAAELNLRLEEGTLVRPAAAAVPSDPLTPKPFRDVLVAGLIGALLGWLGPRLLSHLRT